MQTLTVSLGDRAYPIFIDQNLFHRSSLLSEYCRDQVFVVTNTTVAPLYLKSLLQALGSFVKKIEYVVFPDGEAFKTLETLNTIFSQLLEKTYNRNATLIALGGGVVGDMTGFAAASYQRGVDFVQIPTTLLAQVDSSVGGKTGVNHPLGKNMIGAFYQPKAVFIDVDCLSTLPPRELSAGLAEVIKYGLIYDFNFFEWLELNITSLLAGDKDNLSYAIKRSCEIKAEVVAQDEREGGIRAILNLGHTFGHAVETSQGYGNWLHGEAVGIGMVMAADLSFREGWISEVLFLRAKKLIAAAGLPLTTPKGMTPDDFLKYMAVDKKNLDGNLRLVLLNGNGKSLVTNNFGADNLTATLEAFCH